MPVLLLGLLLALLLGLLELPALLSEPPLLMPLEEDDFADAELVPFPFEAIGGEY